jgi:hypothetical protein
VGALLEPMGLAGSVKSIIIISVCRSRCVSVWAAVLSSSCAHVLVQEPAGVEEVVQAALGLGRLEVPRRLDPLAAIDGFSCV